MSSEALQALRSLLHFPIPSLTRSILLLRIVDNFFALNFPSFSFTFAIHCDSYIENIGFYLSNTF